MVEQVLQMHGSNGMVFPLDYDGNIVIDLAPTSSSLFSDVLITIARESPDFRAARVYNTQNYELLVPEVTTQQNVKM